MRWFVGGLLIAAAAAPGCERQVAEEPEEPAPVSGDATVAAEPEVDLEWRSLDPLRSRLEQPRAGEKLDGPTTLWHPGGGKAGEGNYVDGERDGPWTFWYPSGTVRWQGSYAHGVPHGMERAYHENGQIELEGELDRGQRNGIYRFWYDNGRLELECAFEDDARHGRCRRWTRDGALDPAVSGMYEDGEKVADL